MVVRKVDSYLPSIQKSDKREKIRINSAAREVLLRSVRSSASVMATSVEGHKYTETISYV